MTSRSIDERHSGPMNLTKRRGAAVAAAGTSMALALGVLATTSASADNDRTYAVTVSDASVTIGDRIDVTVAASSVHDLYAYSVDLGFDPALLAYVGDSATTKISGATYEKASAGSVEVTHTKLGSSPAASGEDVTLVTATFTAIGNGAATITAHDLTSVTTEAVSTSTPTVGASVVSIAKIGAPVVSTPPSITGTPRVGSVLTVDPGTWNIAGLQFAYQWTAGGVAISGATQANYRAAASDAGAPVSVQVVASKTGYEDGMSSATSGSIAKASTKTSLTVDDRSIKPGRKLVATIKVTAPGVVPTGTLTFTYRGKTVRQRVTLVGGKATVTFRPSVRGRHTLRATFVPSKGFTGSTDTVSIRIKK